MLLNVCLPCPLLCGICRCKRRNQSIIWRMTMLKPKAAQLNFNFTLPFGVMFLSLPKSYFASFLLIWNPFRAVRMESRKQLTASWRLYLSAKMPVRRLSQVCNFSFQTLCVIIHGYKGFWQKYKEDMAVLVSLFPIDHTGAYYILTHCHCWPCIQRCLQFPWRAEDTSKANCCSGIQNFHPWWCFP